MLSSSSSRLHAACTRVHSCCIRRSFSFTAPKWVPRASGATDDVPLHQDTKNAPATYATFMKDPRVEAWRNPKQRSWLGGTVPYPGNPSFSPPTPISDEVKAKMYTAYMTDPEQNHVRALSERFSISIKRVEAILRLQGMESAWIKGKTTQTAFHEGMSQLLGTPADDEAVNAARRAMADLNQADHLEQEENRDFARQRYQRMYWESVPEDGREPIIPVVLEAAKKESKNKAHAARLRKAGETYMPRIHNTSGLTKKTRPVEQISKDGRPTMLFVDVGGKFLDTDSCDQRMKTSARRKAKRDSLPRAL